MADEPRRMATRQTPDPDLSGSSFSSSYRDQSASFLDEDPDEDNSASSQDETDGAPHSPKFRRRSPYKSPLRGSPRGSPASGSARKPNKSPRTSRKSERELSTSPRESFSASPNKLYPDLSEFKIETARSRRPLHSPSVISSGGYSGRSSPRVRSPQRKTTANGSQETNNFLVPGCFICFTIAVLLGSVYIRPFLVRSNDTDAAVDEKEENTVRLEMLETFKLQMKDLQNDFPSQTTRFWKVLKAAVKRVMRDPKPLQPAIILLAGDNDSISTLECLTTKLSVLISNAYKVGEPIIIRHEQQSSLTGTDLKLLIDSKLSRGFETNSRTAVIHDIGNLPGEAAMMFHAYCDHENAPYKDTVIILTVNLGNDRRKSVSDATVENYLNKQFSDELDNDRLTALLSRIANNIAFVEAEDSSLLRKTC